MRKELQKTWDTKRRLKTWAKNQTQFSKKEEVKPAPMNKNCVYCGKPTSTVIDRKPVCNFEHLTLYNSNKELK